MKRVFAMLLAALMVILPVMGMADIEDYMNLEGLPILKEGAEMPSISVFIAAEPLLPESMDDCLWVKYATEQTGITLDWIKGTKEGALEKVNLLLASNDYPDVFWNTVTENVVSQYIDSGIFMPVQDLIENYMPNLKKIFDENPEYRAMCTAPDGNIYGFPYIEEMKGLVNTPGGIMINKVWLDKVGLPVPTTIEELETALRAFKAAGDLNENGEDDEWPMVMSFLQSGNFGSQDIFCSLAGCFGQGIPAVGQQDDFITAKDGKLVYTVTMDAYKDTIEWFHMLSEEGLLDPASFSDTSTNGIVVDRLNMGVANIGVCGTWNFLSAVPDANVRDQYVPLPRLEGPGGKMGVENNYSEAQVLTSCAITDACEYPELFARFVDFCYAPYESIYLNWGTKDYIFVDKENNLIGYDFDEDGNPNLKDGFNTFAEMRQYSTPMKGGLAILDEYYDTLLEYPVDTQRYLLNNQIVNGKYEVMEEFEALPRLYMTTDEQNSIAMIAPQLANTVSYYSAKWILDGGIEGEWDTYLSELEAAGLQDYLDLYQSVYDRYMENYNAAMN